MKLTNRSSALYAASFACAVALWIAPSVARAQGQRPNGNSPGYSGAAGTINPAAIDDATVKRAAKAYVKVRQIVESNGPAFSSATDDAQRKQIVRQVEASTLAAVKSESLEPEQYNKVLQLAQTNTTFQQRFLSAVQDAMKNSPSAGK